MPEVLPEVSPEDGIFCPSELANFVKCVFCEADLTEDAEVITGAQLLICFHSVCKKCVDGWNESDKKSCPVCKVEVPKDVLSNKLLQEMIDKPHSESTRNGVCGMHSDILASRWCHQCSSLVCDECVQNHYKLKATSTHNLVDVTGVIPSSDESLVEYRCQLHPTMQFEIICHKCNVMTCRDCQLEHHRQHNNYEFIADHCKDYKVQLKKVQDRIGTAETYMEVAQREAKNMEKELLSTKEKLHNDITALQQMSERKDAEHKRNLQKSEYFAYGVISPRRRRADDAVGEIFRFLLVRVVNDRCKELIAEVDSKIEAQIRANEAEISAISLKLVPLKHCSQIVDLMLLHASDNTIIHSKKHLEKCFQHNGSFIVMLPNPDVKTKYVFENGENMENLVSQIKKIGYLRTESLHMGERELYHPVIERFEQLNSRNYDDKSIERPHNPPARIQLRQDLQSPEGIKSMERVSTDSRSSGSPEGGGMLHWHTPQGPPMSKVKKPTATPPDAVPPNVQLRTLLKSQQQPQVSCSTVQMSSLSSTAYTITPVTTQQNPPNQRKLPQDASAPALKIAIGETQQHIPPLTTSTQQVQQQLPQFGYLANQQVQNRPYQRRPSDLPKQVMNRLNLNNISLTSSSPMQQSTTLAQQLPKMQPIQQQQKQQPPPPNYQSVLQPPPLQLLQLQQQQLPTFQPFNQHQLPTYPGHPTYLPGSTHNPYPQI